MVLLWRKNAPLPPLLLPTSDLKIQPPPAPYMRRHVNKRCHANDDASRCHSGAPGRRRCSRLRTGSDCRQLPGAVVVRRQLRRVWKAVNLLAREHLLRRHGVGLLRRRPRPHCGARRRNPYRNRGVHLLLLHVPQLLQRRLEIRRVAAVIIPTKLTHVCVCVVCIISFTKLTHVVVIS